MEQVKIPFEAQTAYGPYRDTLYFSKGQVPSETEIELLKQERIANWIAVITAPPVEIIDIPIEEPPQDG